MTDRELLELAARAHGGLVHVDGLGWIHEDENGNRGAWWRPLEDDGDAMRLAVKCGISIGPECQDVIGRSLCRVSWLNKSYSLGEYGGGDPFVATRRAIVRAAAKIGESKRD